MGCIGCLKILSFGTCTMEYLAGLVSLFFPLSSVNLISKYFLRVVNFTSFCHEESDVGPNIFIQVPG